MRRIAILFVPFVMAGCAAALPPQLALVSQAADGVSYVFTGKSSTDHIVSAAFSRDCAVIRMVQGEAICKARREDTELGQAEIQINGGEPGAAFDTPGSGDQTVALAAVAPAAPTAEPASPGPTNHPVALLPASAPVTDDAKPAPAAKPGEGAARNATTKTVAASHPGRQAAYYVVVGEYRNWDRALDQAGRQTAGVAAIVSRRDNVGKRHRVILGPYARAAAGEIRENLAQESAKTAWLAQACPKPGARNGDAGCMDLAKVWR
jgi:hypothetical protein